jgi:hypothetical protein
MNATSVSTCLVAGMSEIVDIHEHVQGAIVAVDAVSSLCQIARHQKFKARSHINELKPMIPSRCIQIATNEGDVVLDPFGHS